MSLNFTKTKFIAEVCSNHNGNLNRALKFVDFAGLSYLQFPINENYLSPRWFLDLSLNLSLNDHIGFVVSYNHNYDTYTALPIDKYFYSMSMGVRIRY